MDSTDRDVDHAAEAASTNNHLSRRAALISLAAGLAVTAIVGVGMYVIGDIGSWRARQLIEAILPTSRFLCSSIMTATATILALMLTLLALIEAVDTEFDRNHYRRIQQIAFVDMLLLVSATCLLVFQTIPLQEVDGMPPWLYSAGYYALLGSSAAMSGALVSMVLLLYMAIRDFITTLAPEMS